MPSGSSHSSGGGHFGGGGGHSSGGHFGGSSSSGGSGSPLMHRGMRGGRHVFFFNFGGRRYYSNSTAGGFISFLSILTVIAVFACTIIGFMLSSTSASINKIKADYQKYYSISKNALDNPSYQIDGTCEDFDEYGTSGKYCVWYSYKDKNNVKREGYTMYIFTRQQITDFMDAGEGGFKLASERPQALVNEYTDTVDLHYAETTLEDDAEYVDYVNREKTTNKILIIAICVTGALLVGTIILAIKSFKKDTGKEESEIKDNSTTITENKPIKKCKYCGSTLKDNETKCPNCGGSCK